MSRVGCGKKIDGVWCDNCVHYQRSGVSPCKIKSETICRYSWSFKRLFINVYQNIKFNIWWYYKKIIN